MAQQKETLCWRCKRPGTRSCSWDDSKGNVPVEGWTAEEAPYMSWIASRATTTFRVIDCPMFDPEENYEERCKHTASEADPDAEPKKITKRSEIEYFMRCGKSDTAIALRFGLSLATIEKYRREWKKKLDGQERKDKK